MAVPVLAMTHQRPETLPAVGWEPGDSKADILGVGEVQTARRFCSLVGFSRLRVPRGCAARTGVKGFPSCPLPRCNRQSVDTETVSGRLVTNCMTRPKRNVSGGSTCEMVCKDFQG